MPSGFAEGHHRAHGDPGTRVSLRLGLGQVDCGGMTFVIYTRTEYQFLYDLFDPYDWVGLHKTSGSVWSGPWARGNTDPYTEVSEGHLAP